MVFFLQKDTGTIVKRERDSLRQYFIQQRPDRDLASDWAAATSVAFVMPVITSGLVSAFAWFRGRAVIRSLLTCIICTSGDCDRL